MGEKYRFDVETLGVDLLAPQDLCSVVLVNRLVIRVVVPVTHPPSAVYWFPNAVAPKIGLSPERVKSCHPMCPGPCDLMALCTPPSQVYCAKCEMYCITANKARLLSLSNGEVPARPDAVGSLRNNTDWKSSSAAREEARSAAEARMGDMLLLGWTMLADDCPAPGCCFPLMLDRANNTTCVACGGDDTAAIPPAPEASSAQSNRSNPSRAPGATVTSPPAPAPARSDTDSGGGGVISSQEFSLVRKKRDELSAALGRYMLQGWSLMNTTCPREECEAGTPLLKDRSTGTLFCAGCDTRMSEGKDGVLVEEAAPPPSEALPVKRDSSGDIRKVSINGKAGDVRVRKAEPTQV